MSNKNRTIVCLFGDSKVGKTYIADYIINRSGVECQKYSINHEDFDNNYFVEALDKILVDHNVIIIDNFETTLDFYMMESYVSFTDIRAIYIHIKKMNSDTLTVNELEEFFKTNEVKYSKFINKFDRTSLIRFEGKLAGMNVWV